MSDGGTGNGWWQASDGRWYPPTAPPGHPATWPPHPTGAPNPGGPAGAAAPKGRGAWPVVAGIAAVVVLAVGAFAFLGPDSGPPADPELTSPEAEPEPPAVEPAPPATAPSITDEFLASLNIQQTDIGSNWELAGGGEILDETGDCRIPSSGVEAGHVVSYDLRPNGVTGTARGGLMSISTVFADDGAAVRQEGVDGTPEQAECLRLAAEDVWTIAGFGTATPGTIEAFDTGVTAPSLGWRYRTTFTMLNGKRADGYADYVIVRRGRVRLALMMISLGEPFDPALQQLLVNRVSERISQAIKAQD